LRDFFDRKKHRHGPRAIAQIAARNVELHETQALVESDRCSALIETSRLGTAYQLAQRGRRWLAGRKPCGHSLHRGLGDHQARRHDEITGDLPQSLQVVLQGLLD
jgi:hypothetical protein